MQIIIILSFLRFILRCALLQLDLLGEVYLYPCSALYSKISMTAFFMEISLWVLWFADSA